MEAPLFEITSLLTKPQLVTFLSSRGYEIITERRSFEVIVGGTIDNDIQVVYKDGKELKCKNEKSYIEKSEILKQIAEKELVQMVLETNKKFLS